MPETRTALFVRIPESRARQLDSRAHALGRTKQDLVNDLLESALTNSAPSPIASGPKGEADEVLTLTELASLLKLDDDAVLVRVHSGELPGRRFGTEWRFARSAVLDWLHGYETPERNPPGFAGSSSSIGGSAGEGGQEH